MKREKRSFKGKKFSLILIGIGLSVSFWILESLVHVFILKEGTLLASMLTPGYHEFYMRFTIIVLITLFAFLAQSRVNRQLKTQKATHKTEAFLSGILNDMLTFLGVLMPGGEVVFVNNTPLRIAGIELKDVSGKMFYDTYWFQHCEESRQTVKDSIKKCASGETLMREITYQNAKGEASWVTFSIHPIVDKCGKVKYLVPEGRDITERKLAEQSLKDSETKYQTLVENAMDGIVIIQEDKVRFVNPVSQDLAGYPLEELIGKEFIEFIAPDFRKQALERYLDRIKGKDVPNIIEVDLIRKDNSLIQVEANITGSIVYEGKPGLLIIIRDISERKKLQNQLYQAQKMEAIGTLAGGIAHDFNNILMGIQGHASLILTHNDHGSSSKKDLESIETLVESGATLTKQLLAYARGGRYEVTAIDLNEVIQAQNRLFFRMKKDIVLHEKLANSLWIIDADQGQMEQVILNLYINASQAMPDGGDIYIETENVIIDENHAESFHVENGKYIKVMISDTGVGIDESIKQRIFDPFFTTKEMGRGTGLGLASVYGIIKNHGGSIFVSSEKGKGTTFTLYLPGGERKMTKENGPFTEIPKGEGGVLIVDDEDMIVSVSSRLIDKMGYTAFHASNGEEAIEVYKANMDKIDIVILDLIMPGLSGGDTFDRLKEVNPDVKVLLSSGYSIDGQAQEILDRGCNGFIQKPFRMKELSDKLMEILAMG